MDLRRGSEVLDGTDTPVRVTVLPGVGRDVVVRSPVSLSPVGAS